MTESALSVSGRDPATTARRMVGGLLVLSGITHVVQLAFYAPHGHVVGAAAFGVAYFFIGVGVLRHWRGALVVAATLPAVGGVLGTIRFLSWQANPFSVFHVVLDLIIVPTAWWLIVRSRRAAR